MKKFLIATALIAALATPVQAKNALPWVVGGVIGGIILGDLLTDHHHAHAQPRYVPAPQPRCWVEYRTRWNPYYGVYEQVPVEFCQ